MQTFTFSNRSGSTYKLHIGYNEILALRHDVNCDIYNLQQVIDLCADPCRSLKAIWLCSVPCTMGIESPRESFEVFASVFNGDTLEEASRCFVDAVLDVLPSRLANPLRNVFEQLRSMQADIDSRLQTLLETAVNAPAPVQAG